jgi:uncharacterized protein (DUF1330 family)
MTAYWISSYLEINDEAKLAAYAELAGPALVAAGGTFLARGLPAATYESGREQRSVIIEFTDVEAATAAHDSPAYQEALAALGDGALRDLRIVQGLEPVAAADRP